MERPRCCFRVWRTDHRRDNRHSNSARPDDRSGIRESDAANPQHRQANGTGNLCQRFQPDRRSRIRFTRRPEKIADTDIRGASIHRALRLLDRCDRYAENAFWTDDPPHHFRRNIVLTNMDAIGIERQRNIDTVVDNERDSASRVSGSNACPSATMSRAGTSLSQS